MQRCGVHSEKDERFLTCKAVWVLGSKILHSRSSCCCWNSSSQFTTCTMLQQLPWSPACSKAQQGPQMHDRKEQCLESKGQAVP